jgi:hypothetical protein
MVGKEENHEAVGGAGEGVLRIEEGLAIQVDAITGETLEC